MQAELITTVVTAAASYDLASLADVKDELKVTDNASNAILRRYLTSAAFALADRLGYVGDGKCRCAR